MTTVLIKEGYKLEHPSNGQGYRITKNLTEGDMITAEVFEPYGGAPVPQENAPMPDFMAVLMDAMFTILALEQEPEEPNNG